MAKEEDQPDKPLSIAEVAQRLSVNYKTAWRLMLSGAIECFDIGTGTKRRSLRATQQAVEAFIKQRTLAKPKPIIYQHIDPTKSGKV